MVAPLTVIFSLYHEAVQFEGQEFHRLYMDPRPKAARSWHRLVQFFISSSYSSDSLALIIPIHCNPRLIMDIIRSTGLRHDWLDAVQQAINISKSKLRKRAIRESCTEILR